MFKTELHCHSITVSKCGKTEPEDIVEFYLRHGYTTVVLTDHLNENTFKNPRYGDQSGWDWETRVNFFVNGYEKLKEAAGGRLNILLGCEYRSYTSPSDYLLYGVTKDFLMSHPEMMNMKIKEISPVIREAGILFVQAHPFRDGMYVTKPEYLDGMEVWNGNTGKDNRNDIAGMWAERYNLIKTAGTDFHKDVPGKVPVGIETEFPITSNEQLTQTLRSGNYTILRNRKTEDGTADELF